MARSRVGVGEQGYSAADVAIYLGVTNSCITRMISAGQNHNVDDIDIEL
jgi:hypothetical protein